MKSYGQFCPIAKACEALGERWTLLLIRELLCGSHRYNDFKRGLPLISPTMLSQRLSVLQARGLVELKLSDDSKSREYHLTQAGLELEPIVMGLGEWGARWVRSQMSDEDLSVELLMWDMRRTINGSALPDNRTVLHFEFKDLDKSYRHWWMLADGGEIDLCVDDPGFDADVDFVSDLRTMTALWLGDVSVAAAEASGTLDVRGAALLIKNLPQWFMFSGFAKIKSGFVESSTIGGDSIEVAMKR
ncbi:helix-turn-helix domain-containing protein [Amphritea sp. 1_MG-2023]|uniref:winged helix-turn-helix transcriptional regulator n=1 Tax=Amphritea sp. 1_MG-2023 TaxID=3062670 RepID=UPI0026E3F972|nr:helix-turn-helix domain-containing protein [Amphritea sp. 1_MG-2023]MDO6561846.1 helix-turn-helix domain-containing protein [Amphritea sp. 1_MG-2023]